MLVERNEEMILNIANSSGKNRQRIRFTEWMTLVAILFCYFGNEMFFGTSMPTLLRGTCTGISLLILLMLTFRAIPFLPKRTVINIMGIGIALLILVAIERMVPSQYDAPLPWWFFPQTGLVWAACLLGLFLGRHPANFGEFSRIFSWLCAIFGIWVVFSPAVDLAYPPPLTSFTLGYRASAVINFGFCYFLTKYLTTSRKRPEVYLGLLATGLGIFGQMTKSMVFLGLVSLISCAIISFRTIRSRLVLVRSVKLIVASALLIVVINQATRGTFVNSILFSVKTGFFHLSEASPIDFPEREILLQKLTAGRLDIWAESWQRFKASPIIGSGIGQKSYLQLSIVGSEVPWHNTWLEIPLALGLLGVILTIIAGLWLISQIVLNSKGRQKVPLYIHSVAYVIGTAALHAVSSGLVFLTMNLLTGLLVGVLIARGAVIMPLKTRSEVTASSEA